MCCLLMYVHGPWMKKVKTLSESYDMDMFHYQLEPFQCLFNYFYFLDCNTAQICPGDIYSGCWPEKLICPGYQVCDRIHAACMWSVVWYISKCHQDQPHSASAIPKRGKLHNCDLFFCIKYENMKSQVQSWVLVSVFVEFPILSLCWVSSGFFDSFPLPKNMPLSVNVCAWCPVIGWLLIQSVSLLMPGLSEIGTDQDKVVVK